MIRYWYKVTQKYRWQIGPTVVPNKGQQRTSGAQSKNVSLRTAPVNEENLRSFLNSCKSFKNEVSNTNNGCRSVPTLVVALTLPNFDTLAT